MYALQLHAPDAPAALNALHRSIIDAGQLRRRGRGTLVRWICDWACCPVLTLQPGGNNAGRARQTRPKRKRRHVTGTRATTPSIPAVPSVADNLSSSTGSWVEDAAVCVLPDVMAVSRGWFAIRLLQLVLAEERPEQPEADAWLVLMGTPSIHLGTTGPL